MKEQITRKEFLQRLALLGVAVVGSGSLLESCGKKEEPASQTARTTPQPTTRPAAEPCSDVSGLTEADLTMRNQTLKYVVPSPDPAKLCDNCKFWVPPTDASQACGTCQLVKGPIHPKGYCTSWFTREEATQG